MLFYVKMTMKWKYVSIFAKIFQFEEVPLLSKVKNCWKLIYLNRGSLLWMITSLEFENEGRSLFCFVSCPLQGCDEPTRCDTICDADDDMHATTFFKRTINNGEANLYVLGIHINLFHVHTHNLFHNMSFFFLLLLFDTFYCKLHITQCRKVLYCC